MKKNSVLGGYLSAALFFWGCSPLPPRDLSTNPITDCTGGPHCVSTRTQDSDRKMMPVRFTGNIDEFQKIAVATIVSMPRSSIIRAEKNYIYAEFTSTLFRFVDDFEVYFDSQTGLVEMRSSSRIGYNDLGVNRNRVEKFRELFQFRCGGESVFHELSKFNNLLILLNFTPLDTHPQFTVSDGTTGDTARQDRRRNPPRVHRYLPLTAQYSACANGNIYGTM